MSANAACILDLNFFRLLGTGKVINMKKIMKEETVGQRIKAQRIRMGMTQENLAEEMCVPKATISGYETDRNEPKGSVVVELARHLNTKPNYLLGFDEDPIVNEISNLLGNISDEKVKEMLLIQVRALVTYNP